MVRELYIIKSNAVTLQAREDTTGPITGSNIRKLLENSSVYDFCWDGLLCLVFTTPKCNLCRSVAIENLTSISQSWASTHRLLEVVQDDVQPEKAGRIADPKISADLSIHTMPYCLILNRDGDVIAGGLINSPPQVENLIAVSSKREIGRAHV